MRRSGKKTGGRGATLLVVLVITALITILSVGYLGRSDVELACGRNMGLRAQMDYLAESGLQHARGLLLNPQDINADYWGGAVGQQLVGGSDDYYDVNVVKLGECNYQISSTAYRQNGGEQIGRSQLRGELRLDPCIGLWTGGNSAIPAGTTVYGDVYCAGDLPGVGSIYGDAYAKGTVSISTVSGKKRPGTSSPPVAWPGLNVSAFIISYYIDTSQYLVKQVLPGVYDGWFPSPGASNPAHIYYCNGNLGFEGTVVINGTLVVKDDLRMYDGAAVTIVPVKNFPAIIVGHDITVEKPGAGLRVTGLVQVDHHVDLHNQTGSVIEILGALCIGGDGIRNTDGCTVSITAAPNKAAIETWPTSGNAQRWNSAAGAFFKGIERP